MLSITLYIFCSTINLVDWLQNHLIPCPFKALTHLDCPGCGFQRSIIALIKGDIQQSWNLYPPTIPLLILFLSALIIHKFPFTKSAITIKAMIIVVGNFVLISYLYKIFIR
ncbi:DUF2752 domain-containing protein [Pedobacter aquatilis]|uniref:DUF2752 domain-containing protein n=1 Tax=Pedobacter aquatilis TaxID=351343 RepID=UPI00292D07F9|nr:DUF2752 domain-containing protein [Pedobacter aquatilis]